MLDPGDHVIDDITGNISSRGRFQAFKSWCIIDLSHHGDAAIFHHNVDAGDIETHRPSRPDGELFDLRCHFEPEAPATQVKIGPEITRRRCHDLGADHLLSDDQGADIPPAGGRYVTLN